MVPARSHMFHHHHDSSKSGGGKSQYCIAAQIETLASGGGGDGEPTRRRARHPPRLGAMAGDDDAAGTSSRRGGGEDDDDKDWLQLGLASSSSYGDNYIAAPATARAPPEMDMFANAGKQYNWRTPSSSAAATTMTRPPPLPLPIFRSYHHQYGHGGRCRPTAPFLPFARPSRSSGDVGVRVISPPLRADAAAAAGLWLTLQAAPDQAREPILPQIPKSYLRIKDSNMKLEVVMKYLAGKLGLTQSHLQVELTCRGQLLPPFLLVKNVRDSIWCSSLGPSSWEDDDNDEIDLVELHRRSPPAATTDHVMALFYRTSRSYH